MDWVLNNLDNVIIPLIIAVLYFVGNAAQKKAKGEKPGGPSSGRKVNPDEAKRVSEIQEEIRRKIAQRTGRMQPPPPPPVQTTTQKAEPWAKPLVTPQREQPQRPSSVRPPPPPTPAPAFQTDSYRRDIEEKMRRVRELEAQAKSVPVQMNWGSDTTGRALGRKLQRELLKDLAHPVGQRKAIMLSEILGSPVGIKGPAGWKSGM